MKGIDRRQKEVLEREKILDSTSSHCDTAFRRSNTKTRRTPRVCMLYRIFYGGLYDRILRDLRTVMASTGLAFGRPFETLETSSSFLLNDQFYIPETQTMVLLVNAGRIKVSNCFNLRFLVKNRKEYPVKRPWSKTTDGSFQCVRYTATVKTALE